MQKPDENLQIENIVAKILYDHSLSGPLLYDEVKIDKKELNSKIY